MLRRVSVIVLAALPLLLWLAAELLIVDAELDRADALAVLGGSAVYVERTRRAAELFRQGRAPIIILTNDNQRGGWSSAQQSNPFFVERAVDELQRAGVPAERIEVLPQMVASTYEEALLLREHASTRGLRSVLVVTSGYHSRRARLAFCRVFAESGVQVGLATVAPGQQTPRPMLWWLDARGWSMVAGEYVKLIYYWWQHR